MSLTECKSARVAHDSMSLKLGLAGFYQSGISLLSRWHRYRMAINDLRTLDNRLAKDIGINRSCVDEAADAFIKHYRGIY